MKTIKTYFFSKDYWKDFLGKLLIGLVSVYVVLFGLETILPGMVMGVFNANYIFFLSFAVIFLLLIFFPKKDLVDGDNKTPFLLLTLLSSISIYLFFMLFFVLYRVSVLETVGYSVLALFSLKGILYLID